MIALLASALAAEPPLEARLLGPEPESIAAAPVEAPLPPLWPLAAAVGAGLLLVGVRKPLLAALGRSGTAADDALAIVSQKRLGQGGLAVLDVAEPSGETRRLLVGTGSEGPRLLADLSADFGALVLPEDP